MDEFALEGVKRAIKYLRDGYKVTEYETSEDIENDYYEIRIRLEK